MKSPKFRIDENIRRATATANTHATAKSRELSKGKYLSHLPSLCNECGNIIWPRSGERGGSAEQNLFLSLHRVIQSFAPIGQMSTLTPVILEFSSFTRAIKWTRTINIEWMGNRDKTLQTNGNEWLS